MKNEIILLFSLARGGLHFIIYKRGKNREKGSTKKGREINEGF